MQPTQEFNVMLIIRHPHVDPDLLTRELGLEPEYSWRAGDSRAAEAGSASRGTYRETYWATRIYPYVESCLVPPSLAVDAPMPLESVLAIAASILKRRQELWERLKREGATAEFLIAVASCDRVDLKLPADLLAILGGLGLSVSFQLDSIARAAA